MTSENGNCLDSVSVTECWCKILRNEYFGLNRSISQRQTKTRIFCKTHEFFCTASSRQFLFLWHILSTICTCFGHQTKKPPFICFWNMKKTRNLFKFVICGKETDTRRPSEPCDIRAQNRTAVRQRKALYCDQNRAKSRQKTTVLFDYNVCTRSWIAILYTKETRSKNVIRQVSDRTLAIFGLYDILRNKIPIDLCLSSF